jgi:glycosyltransferase involved in cell wall biosynthesis
MNLGVNSACCRPVVSVLMVAFNTQPRYYREAIQSILQQTLQDLELIIVEDPSPQCGLHLVQEFQDQRVRYFANPQRTSLVAQRNRALSEARAEYVAILDSDDIAEAQRLEEQVRYLQQHPEIGVVGSQIAVIDAESRLCGERQFPLTHDEIAHALLRVVPLSQSSVMFRKSAVMALGGYHDHGWTAAEDNDLWSRLALQGIRFANLPDFLVRYRLHGGQIKSQKLRITIQAHLQVKQRYWMNQMNWYAHLWMFAERLVLLLPGPLTRWLLIRSLYKVQRQASPALTTCSADK